MISNEFIRKYSQGRNPDLDVPVLLSDNKSDAEGI